MSKSDDKGQQELVENLEGYVKFLEEAVGKWPGTGLEQRRRIDFTKGVILGLVYGLVGNFCVQFFYPVVESWVLNEYTSMYWIDVVVSAVSFAAILCVTYRYRNQLRRDETKLTQSIKNERVIKEVIKTNREILERERRKLQEYSSSS
jgi:hypothetical protein